MFFDHVHIISEEPESAVTWYVEKLGGKINTLILHAKQLR